MSWIKGACIGAGMYCFVLMNAMTVEDPTIPAAPFFGVIGIIMLAMAYGKTVSEL